MKKAETVAVAIVVLFLIASNAWLALKLEGKPSAPSETVFVTSREGIQNILWKKLQTKPEEVYTFFDRHTRSRQVTTLLLSAALLESVPINLLFALCETESDFNPSAVSKANFNGTRDYGLLALNSKTYSSFAPSSLLDPAKNVSLGAKHLRECFDRYGSWEEALVAYNAGTTDRAPQSTIAYLADVLARERSLDLSLMEAFYAAR